MFNNEQLMSMLEQFKNTLASEDKVYTTSSGGGMIQVSINGKLEVTDITIDDSLLEDKSSLQILLMSAINDAIKMALEDKQAQAMNLFSGVNMQ
ncbi:MAG: YbaB/EbfC family nucleoid-associated protein [Epsilonproteobacteria bacterium]|nr:YbaB/EbfC family nucleoid-associated protein [Campylobacterota bacterium]